MKTTMARLLQQGKYYRILNLIRLGLYFGNSIDLSNCGLSGGQAVKLLQAIQKNAKLRARLTSLNLAHNIIQYLPICDLPALETLLLNNNRCVKFNLSGLPSLRVIDASFNCLFSIDLAAFDLLHSVKLTCNLLNQINLPPHGRHLQTLEISSNNLQSLDISGYPQLNNAFMQRNPLNTVFTNKSPLLKFAFNSSKFKSPTLLCVLARKNADTANTIKDYTPTWNNPNPTHYANIRLTSDDLYLYFSKAMQAFKSNQAQPALLETANVDRSLRKYSALPTAITTKIAVDEHFASKAKTHFAAMVEELLQAVYKESGVDDDASDNEQRDCIQEFASMQLPEMLKELRIQAYNKLSKSKAKYC